MNPHSLSLTSDDMLGAMPPAMRPAATTGEMPGGYQTFEAAKNAGFRGWFYFPNLDPNQQANRISRRRLNERASWIYNNVGIGKAIVNRSSRYEAGTGIWPKPRTSKPEWNKKTMNHFHQRVKMPEVFDLRGEVNFYSAQIAILRHQKVLGDHFGQLVLSDGNTPQMCFHPGYAIDNAETSLDQSLWQDGFYTNRFGRPLQYRVVQNDRSQYTDVSASDMLRFRPHMWTGQRRAVNIFHHAAKHLFDIDDILYFEKAGVRLSSQIGYVLTVPDSSSGGPRINLPGAGNVETVQNEDGSKLTIQRIFGQGTVVPELPPGAKLDLIKSDRTSAAFTGFLDYLIRDVCWGCDYSPEFLWFLAGIGGAPMRFILEDAQMTVDDVQQNQLIPQFCERFYNYFVWQEMKAERLEYPGDDWFLVDWMTPRKMTLDKGREGRLDDERLATGKISPRLYYGPQGLDDEEVEDDIIAAYKRKKEKCEAEGLDFNSVFPPPTGSTAAQQPSTNPNDDGEQTSPNQKSSE